MEGFRDDIRQFREPASGENEAPCFHGMELVDAIQRCATRQEIGSHSFTHVVFDAIDEKRVRSELNACLFAARRLGIVLWSFAFPKNRVKRPELLFVSGFRAYRPPEPVWQERPEKRGLVQRLGNLAAVIRVSAQPVADGVEEIPGLRGIPCSMLWTPSHGARRFLPVAIRAERTRKGRDKATQRKRTFRFWFQRVLEYAAILRSKGRLEFISMGDCADDVMVTPAVNDLHREAFA